MTDPLKHVGAGHYAYDTGVAMAKGELSIDSTFSDYPTLGDAWPSAVRGGFISKNAKDKQGFKAGWDSLGG